MVSRLPLESVLPVSQINEHIEEIPEDGAFHVVNMDGREAPSFNEDEYRNFLIGLNSTLRRRSDLLIVWPINLKTFGERVVDLLREIGGASSFGATAIYELKGVYSQQLMLILDKIMQVANWRLEDAAITFEEADELARASQNVGQFLDGIQELISERFESATAITAIPRLVISVSSGDRSVRGICRGLRRADSYFIEASRLLMYTKRSNIAE